MKLTKAEVKAFKEMNLEISFYRRNIVEVGTVDLSDSGHEYDNSDYTTETFYDDSVTTYDIVNPETDEIIAEDIPENHLNQAIKEIVANR